MTNYNFFIYYYSFINLMNFEKEENTKSNSVSMKNIHNSNKQLFFDMDKNKYYLKYEDSIKLYESNILALKKPKENIPQAGFAKYNDRVLSNSIEKLNFKLDNSLYRPQSLRFEGYSQFPRPIAIPFSNISKIKLQKNLLKDLNNSKHIFNVESNKNILNIKANSGLYFYTGTINNIVDTKNKNIVVNRINEALSFDENENIFKCREKIRDYEKNALKKLKNKILSNSTNTIFGRKLKRPDEKFIQQFNINYNVYFKNPLKKNILKKAETEADNKNYFEEFYSALNKKRVQKVLNSPKKKLFLDIDDNINNNIKKNKSIKKLSKINLNSLNKSIKTNYSEKKILSCPDNFKEEKKNKKNENNKSKNIITYFDSLYLNKNKFKTLDYESKNNYKNILSEENRNNFEKNNILSIRTLSDLNKKINIEKKLLKGFTKPEIIERTYRKAVPKYKSVLNIYKKEWELYKLVNPIRYKLDEKKEMKELKFIQEKLEKGKDFTFFNSPKKRKNKFFATSNILSSKDYS